MAAIAEAIGADPIAKWAATGATATFAVAAIAAGLAWTVTAFGDAAGRIPLAGASSA